MILASLIFIWCGSALLYTLALCQAASGTIPKFPTSH